MINSGDETDKKNTVKATGIIAFSQIFIIIVGIAKTKVFAIILGPSGIGVLGLFQSTIDLLRNFTSFGLNFSAVREISQNKENKNHSLAITWAVIRKWTIISSLLGVTIILVFSAIISEITFGTRGFYLEFILLSLTIPLGIFYSVKISFIQGIRNMRLLAKVQVYAAIAGSLCSLPLILMLGSDGIVFSIVVFWIAQYMLSYFLTRRILPSKIDVNYKVILSKGKEMFKFGSIVVFASLASTITIYIVRIFISQKSGVFNVGIFQAGVTLSTVYLMTVINAMSSDYFPRLSETQNDSKKLISIANEQVEIILNMASVLIVTMLVFSPILVELFYSKKFLSMIPMLQWQIIGSFIKIIAYPLSFLLLARGKSFHYFIIEFLFNIIYILFINLLWDGFGMEGVGLSLVIGYILYLILNYIFVKKDLNFSYEASSVRLILINSLFILVTFVLVKYYSNTLGYLLQASIIILMSALAFGYFDRIFDIKSRIKNLFNN